MIGVKDAHAERLTKRVRVFGKERGLTLLRMAPKSAVNRG